MAEVCGSAKGELRPLLALGHYCGQRLNDLVLLRWEQVDLGLGRIRFNPSKTASRGGKTILVPRHPVLRAILAETPQTGRLALVHLGCHPPQK